MSIGADLAVRISNGKISSGIIYRTKNPDYDYILTAKHCICANNPEKCGATNCDKCKNGKIAKSIEIIAESNKELLINYSDSVCFENDFAIIKTNKLNTHFSQIELIEYEEKLLKNLVSYGYPNLGGDNEFEKVPFKKDENRGEKIWMHFDIEQFPNLDGKTKVNFKGLSGAGVIGELLEKSYLSAIYTDTNQSSGFALKLNTSVNEMLPENWEHLNFVNPSKYIFSKYTDEFLNCFDEIKHDISISDDNELNLFCLKINDTELEENKLIKQLEESIQFFSLSRNQYNEFQERQRQKVGENTLLEIDKENQIPDLLLFNFLEAHKNAPKIFSRAENNEKSFSSIHFFQSGKTFKEIYGFSNISPELNLSIQNCISKAIDGQFEITHTKKLIASATAQRAFDKDLFDLLNEMIIPNKETEEKYIRQKGIALFIGFDVNQIEEMKYDSNFRNILHDFILSAVKSEINVIIEKLATKEIQRFSFDLYFLPFKDYKQFAKKFLND